MSVIGPQLFGLKTPDTLSKRSNVTYVTWLPAAALTLQVPPLFVIFLSYPQIYIQGFQNTSE